VCLSDVLLTDRDTINNQFNSLYFTGVAKKPMYTEFEHMDIYSDIHPFKETSIQLVPMKPNPEPYECYINANRIISVYNEPQNENLIIAAQGPIYDSTDNFWKMVFQENVGKIVTLVHQLPGDCCLYFPT